MNRRTFFFAGALLAAGALAAPMAAATPEIGTPAPAFAGTDSSGERISLEAYRGRTVVLEWTNHQCPYVAKHYGAKNMQALQADAARDGVVWLQVISSAPGLEGHLSGPDAAAMNSKRSASPARVIIDADGAIGRKYAARHTPTMAVIDGDGALAYYGAIDSDSDWHPDSIKGAKNHVRAALADLKAGRPVATAKTRAYGCSVKYAD